MCTLLGYQQRGIVRVIIEYSAVLIISPSTELEHGIWKVYNILKLNKKA